MSDSANTKTQQAPAPPVPPQGEKPSFPPAPEGHVNVLVDGRHAVVKSDDNLIEAARKVGVEIPYFCYHPRLSIAGQCRMCLVETSAMPGRLVAGCHVKVSEGLSIITETPAIKENQRAVMEFHLVNHPVDCPICDQAGECKLQDYYMEHDHKPARLGTYKLNKPKRKVFGPLVVYDGERCILCTRCVRFMNEVAEEPQIAMVGRGDHSEIDTVPGQQLDSKYSGNTVDICPVGALLNRDFRFTSRVWYLDSTPSVCAGCANGCNIHADSRADQVYRYLPRRNEEVNQVWLCDEGRVSYHRTHDDRVMYARVGRDGDEAQHGGVDAALAAAGQALSPLAGKAELAVSISAQCSTEEMFSALVIARDVLRVGKVYATGNAAGEGDDFLIREDKNPNTRGIGLAAKAAGLEVAAFDALVSGIEGGKVQHLVSFGAEVPVAAEKAAQLFAKLQTFVALAVTATPVTAQATVLLPLSSHLEQKGTFVNYYGRLQRFSAAVPPLHESQPAWQIVGRLSGAMGGAWSFTSAEEVFGVMAAAEGSPFAGLTLGGLPQTGLVLDGQAPATYPRRAPRPAA